MKRILIIDDDPLLRLTVAGTLRAQGYEALEAESASTGMAAACAQRPDLVLCDFALDKGNGLEMLSGLRGHPLTATLPFILMTGQEDPTLMRQGMDLGADDFLRKPFSDAQLLTAIGTRLRQREELIHRERALLRTLIDYLPDLIYAKDLNGRKTLANRADYESMGCVSEAEALGKTDFDVYPVELAASFHADDQIVLQSGEPVINREEVISDAQGGHRWLSTCKIPLRDEQDRVIGLVGIGHDITSRKRTEEALRNSEVRFRTIATATIDAIVMVGTNSRVSFWNDAAERIFGYTAGDALGRNIYDLLAPPGSRALYESGLGTVPMPGEDEVVGRVMELIARRKDGSEIPIELSWSSVRVDRHWHGICMARDIGERRRFEEKLRILSRAVDQSPASVVITDTAGNIEYVNPKFCHLTGYALAEVLGKNPRVLKSGETPIEEYQRLWKSILAGGEWRGEFHNRKKNGDLYWEFVVITPIKDENGHSTHFLALKEDITERRVAEQRLRDASTVQSLILENSTLGIAFVRNRSFVWVNGRLAEMMGLPVDKLQGCPTRVLYQSDERYETLGRLAYPILAAGGRSDNTLQLRQNDGTLFWCRFMGKALNPKAPQAGSIWMFENISERKEAEEARERIEIQLRQAQKLESIGQLAAGIAHEINTPTQYIGDNIRFLQTAFQDLSGFFARYDELMVAAQQGLATTELDRQTREAKYAADFEYLAAEIPKAIQQSLDGVERVAKIVRAMKEFSHPGTQQKTLTDLNHAIESTLTVARNEWKYVANVETDFDPRLPLVPCLPGEFNQVILNLLINAAHAIAEVVTDGGEDKGIIAVSTRRVNDEVEIRIRDTGAGIPEKIREKVFDPFFTTKPVGKGTGQGLAIARSVVTDKHGGTIRFESECGQGTTFYIRLPIKDTQRPPENPTP